MKFGYQYLNEQNGHREVDRRSKIILLAHFREILKFYTVRVGCFITRLFPIYHSSWAQALYNVKCEFRWLFICRTFVCPFRYIDKWESAIFTIPISRKTIPRTVSEEGGERKKNCTSNQCFNYGRKFVLVWLRAITCKNFFPVDFAEELSYARNRRFRVIYIVNGSLLPERYKKKSCFSAQHFWIIFNCSSVYQKQCWIIFFNSN